ncbi:unnamed protein product [Trichobilharzia regenti]|nr:unnamed protein product [Trichobilharzia regenti]
MSARDSVDYVSQDRISQLARTYWLTSQQSVKSSQSSAPTTGKDACGPFQPKITEKIYREELLSSGFSHRRCLALELNQYLEQWLWPHFDADKSSRAHVLSICAMVNEKARGRVPIWPVSCTILSLDFSCILFVHPHIFGLSNSKYRLFEESGKVFSN